MSNLSKKFKTDENLEVDGIEIEIEPGVSFTIARSGGANKKYARTLRKMMKPFRRQLAAGTMSVEHQEKIMLEAFCQLILKSWKGVKDDDDNDIECNYENAMALFKELPELYLQLQEDSANMSLYLADIKEAEAKNS